MKKFNVAGLKFNVGGSTAWLRLYVPTSPHYTQKTHASGDSAGKEVYKMKKFNVAGLKFNVGGSKY
ncbi:MAG: hypothetical protein NTX03_02690 [Bacteroidetes bacterium]|nr:hypothetical protein [Bacteroidota bacterium]